MGDFVLSVAGQRTGLRKKIHKMGPNCAVAWTGALVSANLVFRTLRQRFNTAELIKRDALEEALTGFNAADFGSRHIIVIGWIVDGGKHCFRWRSDWPQEVFYDQSAYGGSGKTIVERWCGESGIHESSDPDKIDVDQAIDGCLAIATNLMSIEMLESGNLSQLTFGHGYEALYLAATEFQYVSNILYLAATIEFDAEMKVSSKNLTGPIFKYRAFGEYSVIETFNPSGRGIDCHIITPAGLEDETESRDLLQSLVSNYKLTKNGYKFPVASDFYCVFLNFVASGFIAPPFSIVQPRSVPAGQEFVQIDDDGNLLFNFRTTQLEWMYKTMRADREKSF